MNATELLQKAQQLKSNRSNFETEWQEVGDIFRPTKANITTTRSAGDKEHIRRLYESFPITAVSTLKSIIIGVFFNRSIRPITLSSPNEEANEDKEVGEYLTDLTDMMLKQMFDPKSGFERALSEAVQDDITFGTIATHIERTPKFPIKYHTLNIRDFCIAESRDGDADYIIITTKKTSRQAMQTWGEKEGSTLHESIRNSAETTPFEEFEFQLHIMPREERNKDKIDIINKPIAGYWVDTKNKIIVEETGWNTMPVAIGRSEKSTDEIYGTSRAMIALADARQLNEMSKQINELTELASKPPLSVNANFNKRINLTSGALNYPDQKSLRAGGSAIEQIITVGSVPLNIDLMMRKETNIRETFFLDKLKIFDDPNATATQVMELRAESFRIMGDFITGLVEYMDQVLNRTFEVLFSQIYDANNNLIPNNGLFDKEIPELLLRNPDLKVEYVNPITQSQKITESVAIDKWIQDIFNLAQAKPEVLDNVDFDEIVRKKRQILNIDAELVISKGNVIKNRQARQAQEQEQQALADAQQVGDVAVKAKQAEII